MQCWKVRSYLAKQACKCLQVDYKCKSSTTQVESHSSMRQVKSSRLIKKKKENWPNKEETFGQTKIYNKVESNVA